MVKPSADNAETMVQFHLDLPNKTTQYNLQCFCDNL